MRKIKRGGGPGGSSEWILEEKAQPHGCAKAPSGSPGKEQKGQSQRVGRWRGERHPALCKCGGERDCWRKWETQETLQTPRKGCGRPLSAAQERDGCHQCMDGVWSSRTPGPGQLQRPLSQRFVILPLATGGLCHLSCPYRGGRRLPGVWGSWTTPS